jgi:hypothetical protein
MLERLRKTWELLRGHSLLLLPMACVVVSEFFIEWAHNVAVSKAVAWMATTHSALGFATPVTGDSQLATKRALTELLPLELAFRVLMFSAYFAGFVFTAGLVQSLIEGKGYGWSSAKGIVRKRATRILMLGLALFVGFSVLIFLGSYLVSGSAFLRDRFSFESLVTVDLCLVYSCLAWIFLPASLRLIAREPSRLIAPAAKLQGRIAAISAILGSIALYEFFKGLAFPIDYALKDNPLLRRLLVWPLLSIVEGAPLAPLWVFLAVLIHEDLAPPEIPSPS